MGRYIEDRVGETGFSEQYGQKMTIIEYHNCQDIDVKLEDGTIIKHMSYHYFKHNKTPYITGNSEKYKKKRLGEVRRNRQGKRMRIIKYRSCMDIDIEFEDGSVTTGRTYSNFCNGRITCPSDK